MSVPLASTTGKILQRSHLNYCNSCLVGLLCHQWLSGPNHLHVLQDSSSLSHNFHLVSCLFAKTKWFLFHAGTSIPPSLDTRSSTSTASLPYHVLNLPPSFLPPGYLMLCFLVQSYLPSSSIQIWHTSVTSEGSFPGKVTPAPSVFLTVSLPSAALRNFFLL